MKKMLALLTFSLLVSALGATAQDTNQEVFVQYDTIQNAQQAANNGIILSDTEDSLDIPKAPERLSDKYRCFRRGGLVYCFE